MSAFPCGGDVVLCRVISEFDGLVSQQSQETSKSYYDELAQVRLGCRAGGLKVNMAECFTQRVVSCQLNGLQVQEGDAGCVLRARGCGESRATSNGTDSW